MEPTRSTPQQASQMHLLIMWPQTESRQDVCLPFQCVGEAAWTLSSSPACSTWLLGQFILA